MNTVAMQSHARDEILSDSSEPEWVIKAKRLQESSASREMESKDDVDYRRPTSSGHFTLRSSRIADPLHFIHKLHLQNEDIDPELEELITVLRTTDGLQDISEKDRTALQSFITATLVKQFEHAKETGELPSPDHLPGGNEPMSLKEELADREEEKDGVSVEDDEGDERCDTVADLDFVSASVAAQNKEQVGCSPFVDLDLAFVENHSPLNLDASKQKAQLRQRGSLAKRRKPTRASVRTPSSDEDNDLYNNDHPLMNGHARRADHSPDGSSSSELPTPDDESIQTNIHMAAATQGTPLGTKSIHGIKTAIVRPEVVETGRQRLRSIPPSGSSESQPPSASEDLPPSTPPWLVEARLMKANRTPKGEAEKLRQETEPETPGWMKDALAKKKRAASKSSISQSSVEDSSLIVTSTKSTSATEVSVSAGASSVATPTSPTAVPWIQETVQRKSSRTRSVSPITAKEVANNMNSLIADSTKSAVSSEKVVTSDIPRVQGVAAISKVTKLESNNQVNGEVKMLGETVSPESLKFRSQSSKKSTSPIQRAISPQSFEETPTWRAEVAMRRKSKAYIVQQKPEQPIKLGEVPQWKKDLLEKNKQRRVSDGSELHEIKPPAPAPAPVEIKEEAPATEAELPPWKQEIDQRKKRQSVIAKPVFEEHDQLENEERVPPEEEPEWAQLVAVRRQKLAKFGLLDEDNNVSD